MGAIRFTATLLSLVSLASCFQEELDLYKSLQAELGDSGEHKLQAYGEAFSAYATDLNIGIGADLNFDLSLGYNFPLYSEGQYTVINPKLYV
jgi:hypothetical protein